MKRNFAQMSDSRVGAPAHSMILLPDCVVSKILSRLKPEQVVTAGYSCTLLNTVSNEAVVRIVTLQNARETTVYKLSFHNHMQLLKALVVTCHEPRTLNILISILTQPLLPHRILNRVAGLCFIPSLDFQLNTCIIAHIIGHDPRFDNICRLLSSQFLTRERQSDVPTLRATYYPQPGHYQPDELSPPSLYRKKQNYMLFHHGLLQMESLCNSSRRMSNEFVTEYPRPRDLLAAVLEKPEIYTTRFAGSVLYTSLVSKEDPCDIHSLPRDLVVPHSDRLLQAAIHENIPDIVDVLVNSDTFMGLEQARRGLERLKEAPFLYCVVKLACVHPTLTDDVDVQQNLVIQIQKVLYVQEVVSAHLKGWYRDRSLLELLLECAQLMRPDGFLDHVQEYHGKRWVFGENVVSVLAASIRKFPDQVPGLVAQYPEYMWQFALKENRTDIMNSILALPMSYNVRLNLMRRSVQMDMGVDLLARDTEKASESGTDGKTMTDFVCDVVGVEPWGSLIHVERDDGVVRLVDRPNVDFDEIVRRLEPVRVNSYMDTRSYLEGQNTQPVACHMKMALRFLEHPEGLKKLCSNTHDFKFIMNVMDLDEWAEFVTTRDFPTEGFVEILEERYEYGLRPTTFIHLSGFSKTPHRDSYEENVLIAMETPQVYEHKEIQKLIRDHERVAKSRYFDQILAAPLLDLPPEGMGDVE